LQGGGQSPDVAVDGDGHAKVRGGRPFNLR
jgi:hypothetical protein